MFYNKFISCLYMFRAHVLIIRRSKLYYTASGIITPIRGRPIHRLRGDSNLFHASTCFEHMCSSSGGQNYIIQPLVSSHLYVAVLMHRLRGDSNLFHASTCFEHMCSSSGGQNYIIQPLVSSHL